MSNNCGVMYKTKKENFVEHFLKTQKNGTKSLITFLFVDQFWPFKDHFVEKYIRNDLFRKHCQNNHFLNMKITKNKKIHIYFFSLLANYRKNKKFENVFRCNYSSLVVLQNSLWMSKIGWKIRKLSTITL